MPSKYSSTPNLPTANTYYSFSHFQAGKAPSPMRKTGNKDAIDLLTDNLRNATVCINKVFNNIAHW